MIFTVSPEIMAKKDALFKPTAYDIRAYVGEPGNFFSGKAVLTPEAMRVIAALMAVCPLKTEKNGTVSLDEGDYVVVGHDNGPTSKALADAFCQGLTEQGINVYYIGVSSSGQVYHNSTQLSASGYVQITRSHVEVTSNGAKFSIKEQPVHTYLLLQMRQMLERGTIGRESTQGKVYDKTAEGRKLYIDKMIERYSSYFSARPRKIAINLFGGTALEYEGMFLEIFGADTLILGKNINVNTGKLLADPTRKEMVVQVPGLQKALDEGYRIYSFDLDADRLAVSEGKDALRPGHTGHYVGDDLAYITADHKITIALPELFTRLSKKELSVGNADKIHEIASTVYVDPRYSSSVRAYAAGLGGNCVYHKKGHSHWRETMTGNLAEIAEMAAYGGVIDFVKAVGYQDVQMEASLHMFASDLDDATVRDDGLESAFILEKISDELGIESLKDYFSRIPRRFMTKEIRTESVSNEAKEKITYDIIDKIKASFAAKDGHSIVEFDGQVRADWDTGFIMYGMSNTSPKLTFMAEGETEKERNSALAYVLALHNEAKRKYNDNLPMDISENSFFEDDASYEMPEPDKIDFNSQKAKEFMKAHLI